MISRPSCFAFMAAVGSAFPLLLLAGACGPTNEVRIGGLVSETGAAASYGRQIKQGMDLAVEEIDSGGGAFRGSKLVIDYRDDASDPRKARAAAIDLIERSKVHALVGAVPSEVALAVLPVLRDREIVLVSPSASSPQLTAEGGGWFFRVYPSDVAEAQIIAKACREADLRSAAVLADKGVFGQGIAENFTNEFQQGGRHVVYREDFATPLPHERGKELARKVAGASADAVYLAGYIDDVATLLRSLQSEGFKGARFATSAVTADVVRLAGAASEGLAFPQAASAPSENDARAKGFVAAFRKKYHQSPGIYAAYGYDAVRVLAAALNETRVAAPDEIRSALAGTHFEGVTGTIDFDERGDVRREPDLYIVARGDLVRLEQIDSSIRALMMP